MSETFRPYIWIRTPITGEMDADYNPGYLFAGTGIVGDVIVGQMAADYDPGYAFAADGDVSWKFLPLGSEDISSAATTHTIAGAALSESISHVIAVVGWLTSNATRSVVSATIDGETATIVDQQHNTEGTFEQGMAMLIAPASGAASGDIIITFNDAITDLGVAWFGVTVASATPIQVGKRQTNIDGSAVSLSTTAGGFIVGVSVSDGGATDMTNLTSYFVGSTVGMRASYLYPTTGSSVSVDSDEDWIAASFF